MGQNGEPMSVVDALQQKIAEAGGKSPPTLRSSDNVEKRVLEAELDIDELESSLIKQTPSERGMRNLSEDPLKDSVCICQVE
jgi:hypothetical protein